MACDVLPVAMFCTILSLYWNLEAIFFWCNFCCWKFVKTWAAQVSVLFSGSAFGISKQTFIATCWRNVACCSPPRPRWRSTLLNLVTWLPPMKLVYACHLLDKSGKNHWLQKPPPILQWTDTRVKPGVHHIESIARGETAWDTETSLFLLQNLGILEMQTAGGR